jgi:hypothetical protein
MNWYQSTRRYSPQDGHLHEAGILSKRRSAERKGQPALTDAWVKKPKWNSTLVKMILQNVEEKIKGTYSIFWVVMENVKSLSRVGLERFPGTRERVQSVPGNRSPFRRGAGGSKATRSLSLFPHVAHLHSTVWIDTVGGHFCHPPKLATSLVDQATSFPAGCTRMYELFRSYTNKNNMSDRWR